MRRAMAGRLAGRRSRRPGDEVTTGGLAGSSVTRTNPTLNPREGPIMNSPPILSMGMVLAVAFALGCDSQNATQPSAVGLDPANPDPGAAPAVVAAPAVHEAHLSATADATSRLRPRRLRASGGQPALPPAARAPPDLPRQRGRRAGDGHHRRDPRPQDHPRRSGRRRPGPGVPGRGAQGEDLRLVRAGRGRKRLVLRRGYQGVRERQGGQHGRLVRGGEERGQGRRHHAGSPQGRPGHAAGVRARRGGGQGPSGQIST